MKQVKDILLTKKGISGDKLMGYSERLLEILDDSIKLLKMNYKGNAPVEKKPFKNAGEGSPIMKTAKMAKFEAEMQEREKKRMMNMAHDPFEHNPKLKGVHKMI